MEERGETAAFAVVESFTGWWELAGVDSAVGESAINWLSDDVTANASRPPVESAIASKQPEPVETPTIAWPSDITTLREMVVNGAPLPGNNFGPVRTAPIGPLNPEVMVVSDIPDIWYESDANTPTSANANLLRRMMAAIGIDITECYCSWLASSMPSTAEVPEQSLPELADFMRYQIKLVRPKSLVILGSAACQALLGEQLMNARAQLRNVNHDGRNMTALTTFHPRTLIARPAMKAQAWRDLQMFAQRVAE